MSYAGRRLFTNTCNLGDPEDGIGRDEIEILGDRILSGQITERFLTRIGELPDTYSYYDLLEDEN